MLRDSRFDYDVKVRRLSSTFVMTNVKELEKYCTQTSTGFGQSTCRHRCHYRLHQLKKTRHPSNDINDDDDGENV